MIPLGGVRLSARGLDLRWNWPSSRPMQRLRCLISWVRLSFAFMMPMCGLRGEILQKIPTIWKRLWSTLPAKWKPQKPNCSGARQICFRTAGSCLGRPPIRIQRCLPLVLPPLKPVWTRRTGLVAKTMSCGGGVKAMRRCSTRICGVSGSRRGGCFRWLSIINIKLGSKGRS